jgi:hypothetical protein
LISEGSAKLASVPSGGAGAAPAAAGGAAAGGSAEPVEEEKKEEEKEVRYTILTAKALTDNVSRNLMMTWASVSLTKFSICTIWYGSCFEEQRHAAYPARVDVF